MDEKNPCKVFYKTEDGEIVEETHVLHYDYEYTEHGMYVSRRVEKTDAVPALRPDLYARFRIG